MIQRFSYVRIQGRDLSDRTDKPVGIFCAIHRLRNAKKMTDEEWAYFYPIGIWFEENLPNPPFYDDDKRKLPITWFKTATAGFMLEKLRPLMDIMEKYAQPCNMVFTNFPGRIVYEDEWQVAAYDK